MDWDRTGKGEYDCSVKTEVKRASGAEEQVERDAK